MRDLIRLITKNSGDYDEKYMKIKRHSDDELPLNKTIEIPSMTIVLRAVFMKIKKLGVINAGSLKYDVFPQRDFQVFNKASNA